MSQVNYIQQINLFMEFGKRNGLTSYERIFWLALLHVANTWAQRSPEHDWPDDFFPVSNSEIAAWSGLEERNVRAIRNRFRQIGLIDFRKGDGRRRDPEYRLFYLRYIGYKIVPDSREIGSKNVPDMPNGSKNVSDWRKIGSKNASDCVGDCVGDCAGERQANGSKNVPDCAGDAFYPSSPILRPDIININQGTVKANTGAGEDGRARAREESGGRNRGWQEGEGRGLVDLSESFSVEAGLVPLPAHCKGGEAL